MAEWEAPMTPIWAGVSVGRVSASRVGERAVSRWMDLRWLTGRGPPMGAEPVQRTSRLASTWVAGEDESAGEMETVQVDWVSCQLNEPLMGEWERG